jgi:hypothetical protein
VSDPYDNIPVEVRRERWGWFGEPWPSGTCLNDDGTLRADMRKPFPSGESCLYCGEPFSEEAGDSGQAMPFGSAGGLRIVHVHKECQFRQVAGGLAHHEGRCHCHGGDGEGTPGMTLREEALEVWRRMRAGELYGRSRG